MHASVRRPKSPASAMRGYARQRGPTLQLLRCRSRCTRRHHRWRPTRRPPRRRLTPLLATDTVEQVKISGRSAQSWLLLLLLLLLLEPRSLLPLPVLSVSSAANARGIRHTVYANAFELHYDGHHPEHSVAIIRGVLNLVPTNKVWPCTRLYWPDYS